MVKNLFQFVKVSISVLVQEPLMFVTGLILVSRLLVKGIVDISLFSMLTRNCAFSNKAGFLHSSFAVFCNKLCSKLLF